jgi:hypothetical protein
MKYAYLSTPDSDSDERKPGNLHHLYKKERQNKKKESYAHLAYIHKMPTRTTGLLQK